MQLLIYLISFLEWFTTLSIEIIAIRNFTPIIGTNSISTSIILWVILLALSYWYYIGWKISKDKTINQIWYRVALNLTIAAIFYLFITFIFDKYILVYLIETTQNYFVSILLSSFILFFIPVFLASQTIPLLSELLKWNNTWEKIWKLLFFSTIGSFLWSVLTSTMLFAYLWVEKSAVFNIAILSFLAIVIVSITYKNITKLTVLSTFIFLIALTILSSDKRLNPWIIYEHANSYHNIQVIETSDWRRLFLQNNWFASWILVDKKESFFKYIIEIKNQIINNSDKNILIIWWAGFTLPNELSKKEFVENIDVVDVDKSLKNISEKYFLQEELNKKVVFNPVPSRFFINNSIKNNIKYDSIVIDIYVWNSLAPQTLTYEFFENLNKISDKIYINLITDKELKSDFSKKVLNTMLEAFWDLYYKNVNQEWEYSLTNFVVTNKKIDWYKEYINNNELWIYIDNKNSIEIDLFKIIDN